MSDQFNQFDQILRDRLRDHSATPPASVWDNIQTERSFGHVVANRISSSWRIIGTFLLLTLAGGSSAYLIQKDTIDEGSYTPYIAFSQQGQEHAVHNSITDIETEDQIGGTQNKDRKNALFSFESNDPIVEENPLIADPTLYASNYHSAFGKPYLEDYKLATLVNGMDDWGTASPSSIVRFYEMDQLDLKEFDGNRLVKSSFGSRRAVRIRN